MIAVLEFIFSSFWTFAGCAFLLCLLLDGTAKIVAALRGR
jgi:hypothetical protein